MSATSSGTAFDIDAFRQAVEQGDTDTLVRQFADDADMETVDRRTPPSAPTVIHGRDSIEDFIRQLYSMDLEHEVLQCVTDGEHAAYTERCTYPDGLIVKSMSMLDLADGKIVHQSMVQAWDEDSPGAVRIGDFDATDDRMEFDHGHTESVHLGGQNINRITLEPGWRWTKDMSASVGTDLCMLTHSLALLEGTLAIRTSDGTESEMYAGQVAFVPPGHDAWVVGDQTVVVLDRSMDG
ncbi:nuclear transport factor 2 family protein [Nocardiopsis sp. MG754419]|uniref:nuclear transport factor 2 family protein n=1 Tax=Nocardiopsis sp. MG754419 TaxID=2259865 RepID=UPI001BA596BA|nr:nuclear transport factor 2 family protein [Nocardiopsis sp. MG754419]MBR8743028.1 nuclear transport factor 2 family protein [Nocardiopsis sp. MG754419]